jgi:hypothetical protein
LTFLKFQWEVGLNLNFASMFQPEIGTARAFSLKRRSSWPIFVSSVRSSKRYTRVWLGKSPCITIPTQIDGYDLDMSAQKEQSIIGNDGRDTMKTAEARQIGLFWGTHRSSTYNLA